MRCETPFADGQDIRSALIRTEPDTDTDDTAWQRRDFCEPCWAQVQATPEADTFFLTWRTRFIDRTAANQAPPTEYVPLLDICYEALATDDDESQGLAYLSAMVLRRQKVFRFVRTMEDDERAQRSLIFFDKANQAEVRVPDPRLSPEDLLATRRVLQDRLSPVGPDGSDVPAEEAEREPDRSP